MQAVCLKLVCYQKLKVQGQSDLIDTFADLPKKIQLKYKVFVGSGNFNEVSFLKKMPKSIK